jgi:serine protease AprX
MQPDRGFTWSMVRRRSAFAAGVVALLVANVSGTLAATGDAYEPALDAYSMANTDAIVGAQAWWNLGYTGAGVDVALIDSGVAPVQGLSTPGKIVYGPDLSLESQSPDLTNLDTYGHGTFMAGLIAGRDDAASAPYAGDPASVYRGVAPDARIVSLKVATADGGADVSQVIAAIDWVIQHKNDNGLNIRVLNLSYGTNTTQGFDIDPLAYAVEQAWKNGILVVAAAGNTGYQRGHGALGLANPAYDPSVLAVGGLDALGTVSILDDVPGAYTASCDKCRNPDIWTVGSHLQGLRVPNSFLDANHPEGVIDARYFRGTGTSQATAIASGMAALIFQKYPSLTPDQLKAFLSKNGRTLPTLVGATKLIIESDLAGLLLLTPPDKAVQKLGAKGTGSLEAARGSDHLSRDGVILQGERDIFGTPFDAKIMAAAEASATSWIGGAWNGNTWSGNTWSGNTWSGNTWSGNTWSGNTWSGNTWSGNTWSGNTWSGSSFSGNTWSGNTWSSDVWS